MEVVGYMCKGFNIIHESENEIKFARKRKFRFKEFLRYIFCTCGVGILIYPFDCFGIEELIVKK